MVAMKFMPQAIDLIAHYEPRAEFSLSPAVRRELAALGRRYRGRTLMMGRHSGRPMLQTDLTGISVGSRIEISRLIFRRAEMQATLAEVFRLFAEAAAKRVASGDIQRILMNYKKCHYRPEPRQPAAAAFREVFGVECRFLTTPYQLELGQVVVHQSLHQHLREDGPYHSAHQFRVEAVQGELQKRAGYYEGHRFFTLPLPDPGDGVPDLRFCYSGERPSPVVETAMMQRTDEALLFVPSRELEAHADRYVSLGDYERASRRFGTLWVLQGDLVRPLDRQRASALYLFCDSQQRPELDRWFTWDELFQRLGQYPQINRASRQSSTFLEISLRELRRGGFLQSDGERYRLSPAYGGFQHVTFYQIGDFHKRHSGGG